MRRPTSKAWYQKASARAGMVALLAVAGFMVWEATILNSIMLGLLAGWWIVLVMVVALLVLVLTDRFGAAILTGGVFAVLLVVGAAAGAYWADQAYLQHVAVATADQAPTFTERPALVVARNQVASRLQTK